MATKKVNRHVLWQTDQASIVLTDTTVSTAGKTLTAKLFTQANEYTGTSGTTVGSAAGATAGTNITIPLTLSGVTANAWYSLRIFSDLGGAAEMGVLPNPATADDILIFVLPVP